ncbi:MAG TPA: hypothetical protein VF185_03005 [Patescibacteria group bacterium]
MITYIQRRMAPVKRYGFENYLRIMLTSFALSVIVTRLYLATAGYPQLGRGSIHFAHVLWGGLLLFVATLVPIIFSNKWSFKISALASGIGVGLFIDEVGKFITSTNNYFYPPAAPIIYAFFVLLVLLYYSLKKENKKFDERKELFKSMDLFQDALDLELAPDEKRDLVRSLTKISKESENFHYKHLANSLLLFIEKDTVVEKPAKLIIPAKYVRKLKFLEQKVVTKKGLELVFIAGLALLAVNAFTGELPLLIRVALETKNIGDVINVLMSFKEISSPRIFPWYLLKVATEGVIGVIYVASIRFLLVKNSKKAIFFSTVGLLASLTIINLLVFYFDQFKALGDTLIEFAMLLVVQRYKKEVATTK